MIPSTFRPKFWSLQSTSIKGHKKKDLKLYFKNTRYNLQDCFSLTSKALLVDKPTCWTTRKPVGPLICDLSIFLFFFKVPNFPSEDEEDWNELKKLDVELECCWVWALCSVVVVIVVAAGFSDMLFTLTLSWLLLVELVLGACRWLLALVTLFFFDIILFVTIW